MISNTATVTNTRSSLLYLTILSITRTWDRPATWSPRSQALCQGQSAQIKLPISGLSLALSTLWESTISLSSQDLALDLCSDRWSLRRTFITFHLMIKFSVHLVHLNLVHLVLHSFCSWCVSLGFSPTCRQLRMLCRRLAVRRAFI